MRVLLPLLAACTDPAPKTGDTAAAGEPLATLALAERIVDEKAAIWPPDLLIFDWIQTVWAYGVHRTYAASGDAAHQDYYRAWMDDALPDFHADEFVSSDSTSPALMAATLMWEDESADYGVIVDAAEAYIETVPRTANGAFVHWGPDNPWGFESDQVWVDSQFMLGLFLVRRWQMTDDRAWMDAFVAQYGAFSEVCRDPEDQLYRHAWDDSDGVNIPADDTYWARGNAWVLVAGAEALRAVGPEDPAWDAIIGPFQAHAEAILATQADDGLWYTVLNRGDDPANYTETSAAALIGYALVVGYQAGALGPGAARAAARALAGIEGRLSEDADGLRLSGTSTGTNPSTYEQYLAVPQLDDIMLGWGTVAMFAAEADGLVVP